MRTSIVVVSRNDGYGGNLEYRAGKALNTMLRFYDEVVYVDWCSPNGYSLLDDVTIDPYRRLKHIIINKDDIEALGRPEYLELPIVEVIGRNIGIRRATGDWIVSSNIDIMPGPLLRIAEGLDNKKVYTVQRRNVPVEWFMRWGNTSPMSNYVELRSNKDHFRQLPRVDDGYSLASCCGDYQVAHKDLWHEMRGFEEGMIYRDCADSNLMKKGVLYGTGADIIDLDIFHLDHSGHGETAGVTRKNSFQEWVTDFTETKNDENWGFADKDFYEETI